ncbi:MAG: hypothetical protein SFW35_03160 [Chitinophagales bacterium]|nr:hypothetical protein [Chitinophagales bacterium]
MQPILPVLLKNLEVLDKLYKSPDAKKEFTGEELKKRGLQLNLYITCIEPNGTTKLIFGAYVLIESPDKKTYKIECYDRKHD